MRIHRDGPRLTQLGGDQNFPLPAVSRGYRDALVARVRPVDVLVDPVDSQAFGGVQRVDESHLLRRIAGLVDVSAGGKRRKAASVLFHLCHQKKKKLDSLRSVWGPLTVRKTGGNYCSSRTCSSLGGRVRST